MRWLEVGATSKENIDLSAEVVQKSPQTIPGVPPERGLRPVFTVGGAFVIVDPTSREHIRPVTNFWLRRFSFAMLSCLFLNFKLLVIISVIVYSIIACGI